MKQYEIGDVEFSVRTEFKPGDNNIYNLYRPWVDELIRIDTNVMIVQSISIDTDNTSDHPVHRRHVEFKTTKGDHLILTQRLDENDEVIPGESSLRNPQTMARHIPLDVWHFELMVKGLREIRKSMCRDDIWSARRGLTMIQKAQDYFDNIREQFLINHCIDVREELLTCIDIDQIFTVTDEYFVLKKRLITSNQHYLECEQAFKKE